jgi:hypothetical protein
MLTTLNLTLLVPMYRTRKGAHNDANVVYTRRRLVLLQVG